MSSYTRARFWKCALQVNPSEYIRFRGEDHGMQEAEYNAQLVHYAKENAIKVIGLAHHDRQWQAVMPLLQTRLPELLVLGDYAPDKRTGPAIWLRCVLAGCIEDATFPHGHKN